ncbi:hypothetical protein TNCV_274371 [Trichonephila clavipes]|nr:hypothetical protein TNCV_274371 [Trichonephila clavipes]
MNYFSISSFSTSQSSSARKCRGKQAGAFKLHATLQSLCLRKLLKQKSGRRGFVVKVWDHGWLVTSSSPVPLKKPLLRGAMHVKSVESSNVLPLVWYGSLKRDASSDAVLVTCDHGSKLRGSSPKALV